MRAPEGVGGARKCPRRDCADVRSQPVGKPLKEERLALASEVSALMKSEGISEMDALKRVARERGIGKSEAYRELQREQNRLR